MKKCMILLTISSILVSMGVYAEPPSWLPARQSVSEQGLLSSAADYGAAGVQRIGEGAGVVGDYLKSGAINFSEFLFQLQNCMSLSPKDRQACWQRIGFSKSPIIGPIIRYFSGTNKEEASSPAAPASGSSH